MSWHPTKKEIQKLAYQPHFKEPPPENTERIKEAVDIPHMSKTLFIVIGAGGSQTFCENIVRMGSNVATIDMDKVEPKNIGTQGVYGDETDVYKVDALKARLKKINPNANIFSISKPFEKVSDDEFEGLAQLRAIKTEDGKLVYDSEYNQVVILGCTDKFEQQDRCASLGQKYRLPVVNVQLYQNGYAAELVYTNPADMAIKACIRCCLSPRYKAYLSENFQNHVGTSGSTIFSTEVANALKGFVATAIGHTGILPHKASSHPRWKTFLEKNGNKHLIQISLDPSIETVLGMKSFSRTFEGADQSRMMGSFFQTQFIPQSPDESCPSCGGVGNPLDAMASWRGEDTRIIRSVFPSNKLAS
ncbi:MAG: ThiF family adenylyltransferase [Magnetococcales bacterium]|nr:ThiF family adenylyltransferase [Magnetococcales bacterium]